MDVVLDVVMDSDGCRGCRGCRCSGCASIRMAFYRWDSASTGVSSEVDLVLKVSRYLQIQEKQNRIKSEFSDCDFIVLDLQILLLWHSMCFFFPLN